MTTPTPRIIRRSDPTRVEIEWNDGRTSAFTAAELRAMCPCARCVDELSGVRRHDPSSVPADLHQSDLALVGTYALTMRFSDGHHTGIYPYAYLLRHALPRPTEERDGA